MYIYILNVCVQPPGWQSEMPLHVVTLRSNGTRAVFIQNAILINMILTLTRNKIRLHFKLRHVFTTSTVRVCTCFLPIVGAISRRALVECISPNAGANAPTQWTHESPSCTDKKIVVVLTNSDKNDFVQNHEYEKKNYPFTPNERGTKTHVHLWTLRWTHFLWTSQIPKRSNKINTTSLKEAFEPGQESKTIDFIRIADDITAYV